MFINITAAWCLSCKYNEVTVLDSKKIYGAIKKYHINYLKGDWTNQNKNILNYLQSFGRSGVPLYIIYTSSGKTKVLPQLLRTKKLIQAFKEAAYS